MYGIQTSSKRHLTNLLRGVKLKKTLATIRINKHQASIFQTKDKKKSVIVFSIFCEMNYLWTFALHLLHMQLSRMYQNLLLERSWNGDHLVLQGPSFEKSLMLNALKTEKYNT